MGFFLHTFFDILYTYFDLFADGQKQSKSLCTTAFVVQNKSIFILGSEEKFPQNLKTFSALPFMCLSKNYKF